MRNYYNHPKEGVARAIDIGVYVCLGMNSYIQSAHWRRLPTLTTAMDGKMSNGFKLSSPGTAFSPSH